MLLCRHRRLDVKVEVGTRHLVSCSRFDAASPGRPDATAPNLVPQELSLMQLGLSLALRMQSHASQAPCMRPSAPLRPALHRAGLAAAAFPAAERAPRPILLRFWDSVRFAWEVFSTLNGAWCLRVAASMW